MMNEELINAFFNLNLLEKALELLNSGKVTISENGVHAESDNKKLHLKSNDNGYSFYYSEVTDTKVAEDFKKYCNALDDSLFMLACEKFAKTGHSTSELDEMMKRNSIKLQEYVTLFKQCVSEAAKERIEYLKAYID